MPTTKFPIERFKNIETPFYYYDMDLLRTTLAEINAQTSGYPFHVHYAVKANANKEILSAIRDAGLGIDCVSGGEVKAAIEAGIKPSKVVFAGVAKTDKEIILGLESGIFCFNVESLPELENINELASQRNITAKVAIRVNPNIDAHTHKYITTGLAENKFGINLELLPNVVNKANELSNIDFIGVHFHIGSQLTQLEPYHMLCQKINELQKEYDLKIINVGGGLGVDYDNPDANPIACFKDYFNVFKTDLKLKTGQELHFELGRSVVAQCGSLISRVIYIKKGTTKQFVMLDAGFTDLIRPALYQAHHKIENISNPDGDNEKYDVVGPICESSDCFGTDELLPVTKRGDFLALRSAGAYGQIMASQYNCRPLPKAVYSE